MLSYDIRSLATRAVHVDGVLAEDDPVWQDEDTRPSRPVHVVGRLSAAGPGRYYFSGHLDGEADAECRRCLTDVTVSISEDVQLLFVEADTDLYRSSLIALAFLLFVVTFIVLSLAKLMLRRIERVSGRTH